jgi:hypothetical protein
MLLTGTIGCSGCAQRAKEADVTAAKGPIPPAFRGYWSMTDADAQPLAAPYPDYEVEIAPEPAACAVYKGKGVSRLEMFRGAEANVEGGAPRLTLIFRAEDRSFALDLGLDEKAHVVGHVKHVHGDAALLDADVRLIAKPAPPR